jgi:hypothetical protein
VLTPFQITAGKPVPGKRVLVLDGDGHFMGITMAELMANQGKEVTYVCDAGDIAEYGVFTMESFNNKRLMFEKGIKVYTSHWLERIEPGKVRLSYLYKFGPDLKGPSAGEIPRKDNGGEFDLGVDAVILVTSRRSDDGLWRAPRPAKPNGRRTTLRTYSEPATARRRPRPIRRCGMLTGSRANSTAPTPPIRCLGSASASSGATPPSRSSATRGSAWKRSKMAG